MNNRFKINQSLFNWISGATAVGVLTLILGVLFSERIWPNVLLAAWYITGIGFSGIMFVAIHYVSNAGWGVAIRRIPEAMFAALPIGFLLMILVVLGAHHIYEWTHLDVVAKDPILQGKQPWLNLTGFIIRIPIYFGLWFLFGKPILNHSRKQDEDGDASHSEKSMRWSAAFLYLGGIAFVIASFDWIMSVEPHWFSTIFGFYNFAGMFDAGLAFMIILLIYLRRGGYLPELKNDHLHELGRYLFAFTTFWVYIWFSQHMLIWYANLPEETGYYLKRHFGSFGVLAVLNICLNWLIPFMILMFRKTKRSEKSLLLASFIVLAGHWTDLYMMIFPPLLDTDIPVFGVMEIGVAIGIVGVILWSILGSLAKWNLTPKQDPYLGESLNLHT